MLNGCRWCGVSPHHHTMDNIMTKVLGRAGHRYTEPTQAQRDARLRAALVPRAPHVCTPNLTCEHQKSEE